MKITRGQRQKDLSEARRETLWDEHLQDVQLVSALPDGPAKTILIRLLQREGVVLKVIKHLLKP